MRQPVSVGGSGSSYIYGFMDSNYKPGLSKDQCLDLTTKGTPGSAHRATCISCSLTRLSASQRSLWPWRGTGRAGAWSGWPPSLRTAWRGVSSWETSCPSSPRTERAQSVCSCPDCSVNKGFTLFLLGSSFILETGSEPTEPRLPENHTSCLCSGTGCCRTTRSLVLIRAARCEENPRY